MTLLADVKLSMRISHSLLDADIQKNIDVAFLDMARVGIANCTESVATKLQKQCVEFYCKQVYNYEGIGERWGVHYQKLRDSLSLALNYISPEATPEVIGYSIASGKDLEFALNHYITAVKNGATTLTTQYSFEYPTLTIKASYLATLTGTVTLTFTTLNGDGTIRIIVGA
jgi:hypothetical protein